jgi:hypothetical protein
VEGKVESMRFYISGSAIVRMAGLCFFLGLALGIYFATMANHHNAEQGQASSQSAPVYMHHSVGTVPGRVAAG